MLNNFFVIKTTCSSYSFSTPLIPLLTLFFASSTNNFYTNKFFTSFVFLNVKNESIFFLKKKKVCTNGQQTENKWNRLVIPSFFFAHGERKGSKIFKWKNFFPLTSCFGSKLCPISLSVSDVPSFSSHLLYLYPLFFAPSLFGTLTSFYVVLKFNDFGANKRIETVFPTRK